MSKVLIIPDTHLKPKMFDLADKIMREHKVDYAVQLGDNLDDFFCGAAEYDKHWKRMVKFRRAHPETVWLRGNHEVSYLVGGLVTGNTIWGVQFADKYERGFHPKTAHIDGMVIFSHAGIFQEFIDNAGLNVCQDVEELVYRINNLELRKLWYDYSPIWARWQYKILTCPKMLTSYVQVAGHTPIPEIDSNSHMISTDVFSTEWGKKISSERMIIVDTKTGKYKEINIDFRKEFGDER